jgi:hypothetical protein
MTRYAIAALAALNAVLLASVTALAQVPPRTPQEGYDPEPLEPGADDTVRGRPRPDYDPLGLRVGGFFLYPRASVSGLYRDNIFYRSANEESDFVSVFTPELRLRSNWNAHALNLFADANVVRYADNSDENHTEGRAGFDGRIDVTRSTAVLGNFAYARLAEERSSPDQTAAAEPTRYDKYGPSARLTHRLNRLRVQLGGGITFYDFEDVPAIGGGTINMDDRDRSEAEASLQLGYEIVPNYEAFVRTSYDRRNYRSSRDDAGLDRDSDGWEVVAGLGVELGRVTYGNVFVGYLRQDFDDPILPSIEGIGFGGDVTWNPTQLTTVKFAASRIVEETTLAGAAGALTTRTGVTVDHELLRNLILTAQAQYANHDYDGISRDDDVYGLSTGGDYLLNRNVSLRLRYAYARRDSSAVGGDYSVNSVLLRLVAQY